MTLEVRCANFCALVPAVPMFATVIHESNGRPPCFCIRRSSSKSPKMSMMMMTKDDDDDDGDEQRLTVTRQTTIQLQNNKIQWICNAN